MLIPMRLLRRPRTELAVRFQTCMPPNRPLLLYCSDSPPVHSQMDWFYWYKFMWKGRLIRESTKQGYDKVARSMESAHRTSLAKGEVGIRDKKTAPTLAEFLKRDFIPFVETQH